MVTRRLVVPLFLFAAMATATAPTAAQAQTGAGQSAVVLNYQRFDEDRFADTSVPAALFDQQVGLLAGRRYNVVPAEEIVDAVFNGKTLPNRSVAITIDDAYRSVYDVAWPRLRKAGLPFTLFVSTDAIDDGGPGFMTWAQIRELRDAGVTIGTHGAAHLHMATHTPEEIRADIERSIKRIEEKIGERPVLFSYPHGEMTLAARDQVAAAGLKAAFGQHSGTVNETLDRFMLPRFSINGNYGSRSEFIKRVDALGLPLRNVTPADPYMVSTAAPEIAFTLGKSLGRVRKLHCFNSTPDDDFVEAPLTVLDERHYQLRFDKPFPPGPWRLNCTIPTGGKRIRWWGMQYYTAG